MSAAHWLQCSFVLGIVLLGKLLVFAVHSCHVCGQLLQLVPEHTVVAWSSTLNLLHLKLGLREAGVNRNVNRNVQ